MSQYKKIFSKNKNLLIAAPVLIALGCSVVPTSAQNSNIDIVEENTLDCWHPYKNFLNVCVPQEVINQETPIGITLGDVSKVVEMTYIEGESPLYINGILISNKKFALPSTFNPGEDTEARQKFEEMKEAASKEGIYLNAFSTFRSYQRQEVLYNNYVARDGQEKADTYSARPGHSEHQTGYTFDIGGRDSSAYANDNFTGTTEQQWLAENAHKYGFVLRYLKGKEHLTGYKYESWHYRYVGTNWSTKIHESGLSLEEYMGLNKLDEITICF